MTIPQECKDNAQKALSERKKMRDEMIEVILSCVAVFFSAWLAMLYVPKMSYFCTFMMGAFFYRAVNAWKIYRRLSETWLDVRDQWLRLADEYKDLQ